MLNQKFIAKKEYAPKINDLFVAKGDEIVIIKDVSDYFLFDFTNPEQSVKNLIKTDTELKVTRGQLQEYFKSSFSKSELKLMQKLNAQDALTKMKKGVFVITREKSKNGWSNGLEYQAALTLVEKKLVKLLDKNDYYVEIKILS